MLTYDPRVDAYIAKMAPFAQPILEHLRELVHEACPEVTETLKWGMPSFEYKGLLCGFAAFKAHCTFGFWKAALMEDPKGALKLYNEKDAMGSMGKITSLKDLPKDSVIKALVKEARRLNDEGIKVPKKPAAPKPEIAEPDYLTKALKKNAAARKTWEGFSPSCKREYLEWLTEAKTEPTREKRLATTLAQLEEGKQRNWKYQG